MPRAIEELAARIHESTTPGFRGRLLARGFARNLIWSKGQLPENAPEFSPVLSGDLLSYGLALFNLGLELRSQDRGNQSALDAFARAGEAIESVIRDGDPEFNERGFYTVIAAAAYHLGHFSARAFSLFPSEIERLNLSPAEYSLTLLMRRNFGQLKDILARFSADGSFDATLAAALSGLGEDVMADEAIFLTLNSLYHQSLCIFDYALDSGSGEAVERTLAFLDEGIAASNDAMSVPFWWVFTITRHMIEDLWDQSLHVRLPLSPDDAEDSNWMALRRLFIAKLRRQNRAEIELWPSQIAAAARAYDMTDDLVAALPTSAGKTRIAEICILRALSIGTRVVFVTPLRALSAQTERSLRQMFAPLGFSVSSLYGSSGATGDDSDSLKNRNIVISTPEKLDFALRNDPSLLADVGLIVLDEAHTIGAGEREVRYEILVQRLLRRPDAANRRIVCLSAILPQGEQLHDFVSWIRQDQEGDAVTVGWRPTRQRFGEIAWGRNRAILTFRVEGVGDDDAPYIDPFITHVPPRGQQTKSLPRDRRDLCIMSAWRLVEEGQTVLLYCPERRSVIPTAKGVLDLVRRGYLPSLLSCDPSLLTDAINIGREWLGENHPALQCLKIGVAVHHGQLPRPFLRAVEGLLKDRHLKVTISSPTLAQGLNLSATTVIFCALKRGMGFISGEEFANVAGRAGRAFVDVEGQVICAAWEGKHLREWDSLLKAARERNIKSGLLQLIVDFCDEIISRKNFTADEVLEYITGNANVWKPPKAEQIKTKEEKKAQEDFEKKWGINLASLDSALLSLVQHDVKTNHLAEAIDEALKSSLWERSLKREDKETNILSKALLNRRADYIWSNSTPAQRKGYFFAGVSFATGKLLDKFNDELVKSLDHANKGMADQDLDAAHEAIVAFAEIVFTIEPFTPNELPNDWQGVLKDWLRGNSFADLAGYKDEEILEFIEGAVVYRLVWAMESVRVKQSALRKEGEEESENAGRAALAMETGTSDYPAALLIQSGLASRIAAIKATSDCPANFTNLKGLRQWLRGNCVRKHEETENWPTPETASLWRAFVQSLSSSKLSKWSSQSWRVPVKWLKNGKPKEGEELRLMYDARTSQMDVHSIDMTKLGLLPYSWAKEPCGIGLGTMLNSGELSVSYLGPNDLFPEERDT